MAETAQVRSALRKRYPAPEWSFLEEVRNGTGHSIRERYADAIALNLWPSRGMELHGFEIKVSRYDWTKELQNPLKSESIQNYCDRWWLVAGDEKIVQDGELPPTWGLYVLQGQKLVCKREAPKLSPKELDRKFIASILRRATESLSTTLESSERYREGYVKGLEEGKYQAERETDRKVRAYDNLQKKIDEFEKKSGIHLNTWDLGNQAEAVQLLMQLKRYNRGNIAALESAARPLRDSLSFIDAQLAIIRLLNADPEGKKPGAGGSAPEYPTEGITE